MIYILFVATFVSFFVAVGLVRYQHVHAHFSADSDLTGVQKFHAIPVPRIGGVPVFCGLLFSALMFYQVIGDTLFLKLLGCALPAFATGLLEDLTKKVGPLPRLLATFLAALIGGLVLNAVIPRLDIPYIDPMLLAYPLIAIGFTMFAVGGVAHAINIIDGYNGLSSMVAMLIFVAMAYVAFKVSDIYLVVICLSISCAIFGFFLLNYPRGLIFAGDGGAYLVGFLIAEVAVLLVARNPAVSPWFPLLLVIYPVFETIFSIYRRKFLQGRSIGYPDALHLHQVVYKRLVRWMVGSKESIHMTRRNSLTSPYLWALCSISAIPAMMFWRKTGALILCVVLFVVLYIQLYRMIVRFKSPSWMVTKDRSS